MAATEAVERALKDALSSASHADCPPCLHDALHYAVFPGGARIRPKLTLSVARACAAAEPGLAVAAAAAVELMHCASLVHDDLPCFDDAETRRGKPSLHLAYDERLAVLAGDALIVLAFEVLGNAKPAANSTLAPMLRTLAQAASVPRGIVAGQAWECEQQVNLPRYQRQKTGALFVAATCMGAAAAGTDTAPWALLGERLGEAYQVADDILDVTADPDEIGKPVGSDAAHLRPNSVLVRGMARSRQRLEALVAEAVAAIPRCPGEREMRVEIAAEARRFIELALHRSAAA